MAKLLAEKPVGSSGIRLDDLAKLRLLALRRGVFYRVLNRTERALIYLVPKVIANVRSKVLASALHSIVEKLLNAMETKVSRQMIQIGVPLAEKISKIAQNWGNKAAGKWAIDLGFTRYLAITLANSAINNSIGDP